MMILDFGSGIVLMRGQILDQHMTIVEGQYLINFWQLYLLDDDRYKLVRLFNHQPGKFDFNRFLAEVKVDLENESLKQGNHSPLLVNDKAK